MISVVNSAGSMLAGSLPVGSDELPPELPFPSSSPQAVIPIAMASSANATIGFLMVLALISFSFSWAGSGPLHRCTATLALTDESPIRSR